MRASAFSGIDPSIAVSLIASGVLLGALATSGGLGHSIMLVARTLWLYLTNARG
jgi:hypothetical protein